MPYQVGIDEAGYGPNLGPLVQACVAVKVPEWNASLWEVLKTDVRKAKEKDQGRLLIDDSKKVNEGVNGLAKLERSVLGILFPFCGEEAVLLEAVLQAHAGDEVVADLRGEKWFDETASVPAVLPGSVIAEATARLIGYPEIDWVAPRIVLRTAERYNRLLDVHDLKSNVLALGVVALLQQVRSLPGTEAIHIAIDKLGGRNFYAPMLQAAFPNGWPQTLQESSTCCRYRILGLERDIELTFQPRADGEFLPVALASMLAKYLRELCMKSFNDYWCKQLPGLAPTAGYPVDAVRFMKEIEPKLDELKIARESIWRRK